MSKPLGALAILAAVALLAALVSGGRAQAPNPVRPAAVVNGETISLAEVEAVMNLRQAGPNKTDPKQWRQLEVEALATLIDEHIMKQFLRKNAPPVDQAEVAKRIDEFAASLKAQKRSLQDFYRETGQTEAQLQNSIANIIQWAGYVNLHLTDDYVKKFYQANQDVFDQVTVRASHIILRMPLNAPESERQAGRAKLEAWRQDILSGKADFGEVAKKYSQCDSGPSGGDLGFFPRKWVVPEPVSKTAFAMRVGDISGVVETDYGLHLIKVTDRKPGTPVPFDKIKDDVRDMAAEEMMRELLAKQRKNSLIEVFIGDPSLKAPGAAPAQPSAK